MSLRSPLGRARGLGSAKEGTGHFWAQRVTAVALIPLTFMFVVIIFIVMVVIIVCGGGCVRCCRCCRVRG